MTTIILTASIFILLIATFAIFLGLFKVCYGDKDITKQVSKEPILQENELFKVMMDSVPNGWVYLRMKKN